MTADWIALDHAATTPLAPGVFEAMRPWLDNAVGNPASDHRAGRVVQPRPVSYTHLTLPTILRV